MKAGEFFHNKRASTWIPKTPLNRRTSDGANSKERREMAAGNFWVCYAWQFFGLQFNSLMTVELHLALSITPCLSVLTPRTMTASTSEVAIGFVSSFKQKSGATVRVTGKVYPLPFDIRHISIWYTCAYTDVLSIS